MTTSVSNTHFLRVFTNEQSKFGDLASVVVDEGRHISDAERQALTRELATSETAFINNVAGADISIMHYQGEVDFAGTVVLATSWLLAQLQGNPVATMHGRGGDIITWQEDGLVWVQAGLATMPPWHHKQVASIEEVEHLSADAMKTTEHTVVWAWIDEAKGLIRARTFANDWEIPEAQGNGSGSMMLAAQLKRCIEIKHGEGSVIYAKPGDNNQAAIGGRVVEDKQEP